MAPTIKLFFLATADHDSFSDSATARAKELCKSFYRTRLDQNSLLPAPAVLRFIHFNHFANKIRVFDFALTTNPKPKPPDKIQWHDLNSFVATGDPQFSPATFVDDGGGGDLTILHIYHSIRGAPAKSVRELRIFSHGWAEGPILRASAPSSDDNPPASINNLPIRDSSDTDGRARTDFAENMGEDPNSGAAAGVFPRIGGKDALKEFKAAFDDNASFWICGCNGQDPVRDKKNKLLAVLKSTSAQVIRQAYLLPTAANEAGKNNQLAQTGAAIAKGNLPAEFTVTIDMGAELKDERRDIDSGGHYTIFNPADKADDMNQRQAAHYGLDDKFFPTPTSANTVLTPKWTSILGFIARRMQTVYPFKAASALGIAVFAGPVGVKSSLISDKQMRVCGEATKSECGRILGFHEDIMKLSRGDRNYFLLDAQSVASINTLAQNP
jgi:hypothetical protein